MDPPLGRGEPSSIRFGLSSGFGSSTGSAVPDGLEGNGGLLFSVEVGLSDGRLSGDFVSTEEKGWPGGLDVMPTSPLGRSVVSRLDGPGLSVAAESSDAVGLVGGRPPTAPSTLSGLSAGFDFTLPSSPG